VTTPNIALPRATPAARQLADTLDAMFEGADWGLVRAFAERRNVGSAEHKKTAMDVWAGRRGWAVKMLGEIYPTWETLVAAARSGENVSLAILVPLLRPEERPGRRDEVTRGWTHAIVRWRDRCWPDGKGRGRPSNTKIAQALGLNVRVIKRYLDESGQFVT